MGIDEHGEEYNPLQRTGWCSSRIGKRTSVFISSLEEKRHSINMFAMFYSIKNQFKKYSS